MLLTPVYDQSPQLRQPVTLIDIRTTSLLIASTGRLTFGFLNVCSLMNNVDNLLELRNDRHIDVTCLPRYTLVRKATKHLLLF